MLITVTQAQATPLDVVEQTLGSLEAMVDPKVSAEIAGRVLRVAARSGQAVKKGQLLAEIEASDAGAQHRADQAEAARLESLLAQQERVLARQSELLARNFISRNALDDALAQRDALKNQLLAARSRAAISAHAIERTRVVSPVDGVVEVQIAAVGDYLKVGDPLLRLVSNTRLRANLPFPESVAHRLKPGLPVRLSSPQLPGKLIEGEIEDIRPSLIETSRAVEAIVRLHRSPGDAALRSGGSLDAQVIVDRKPVAVMVPEQAVVQRPAGRVVYRIAEGRAQQQAIETGVRQGGMIEILRGVHAGDTLALDGAGFLTDGAAVLVKDRGQSAP